MRNDTAFTTGVDPSLTCVNRVIGIVGSDPIKKSVVLKLSKDKINDTAAPPISAGLK